LESLARNPALVDGKKRTAIVSTGIFLQLNGRRFHAEHAKLEAFVLQVAKDVSSVAETANWIDSHSGPA
jgi:prophage maintenance system killer protein